eukprot:NODE_110_length_19453_cov_0.364369.p8 type:complete len:255 gc:universal NODE_110_length_19453_cov_0.364369:9605-8841(-)
MDPDKLVIVDNNTDLQVSVDITANESSENSHHSSPKSGNSASPTLSTKSAKYGPQSPIIDEVINEHPQSDMTLSIKSSSPINASFPITSAPDPKLHNNNSVYVSKLDAGIAILLTNDMHLIEWPISLLPLFIKQGMYFDLNISVNKERKLLLLDDFKSVQDEINAKYSDTATDPVIKCLARGHAVQIEFTNYDSFLVQNAQVLINDVVYRKPFECVASNCILVGLDQDQTYSIQVQFQTPNGRLSSNIASVQVI